MYTYTYSLIYLDIVREAMCKYKRLLQSPLYMHNYTCMYMRMHTCKYVCMQIVHTYINMCIDIDTRSHEQIAKSCCTFTDICTNIRVCTYICVNTNT